MVPSTSTPPWRRRGLSGRALDYDADSCGFKSHSGQLLENSVFSPSNKWVSDTSCERLGSKEREMAVLFTLHVLCPRHSRALITCCLCDQQGYGILYFTVYPSKSNFSFSASKTALNIFMHDKAATNREKDLFRSVKVSKDVA